nr:uncharacterized protein LOC129382871 [Dermacentor andersoni]
MRRDQKLPQLLASSSSQGEKLYAARHVNSVKEIAGVTVLAKCHSQQGKHNYSVSLDLNKADRALSGGSCTCQYGASGNCKHFAAVVIYINESEDVSTTSQPQQWHRERRVRITCSMAHTILRTRKAPADLVNTLLRTTSISSEATTYGIKMEALARKKFEDKVSVQVIEGHKYYTPVQLLMYVCNVQSCYLLVYSSFMPHGFDMWAVLNTTICE